MRPRAEPRRDWILPGTTVVFGAVTAVVAPVYERAFGADLPAFTQRFLALYPLWIALGATALALVFIAGQLPLPAQRPAWRAAFDALLTLASIGVVVLGIIALALPVIVPHEAR